MLPYGSGANPPAPPLPPRSPRPPSAFYAPTPDDRYPTKYRLPPPALPPRNPPPIPPRPPGWGLQDGTSTAATGAPITGYDTPGYPPAAGPVSAVCPPPNGTVTAIYPPPSPNVQAHVGNFPLPPQPPPGSPLPLAAPSQQYAQLTPQYSGFSSPIPSPSPSLYPSQPIYSPTGPVPPPYSQPDGFTQHQAGRNSPVNYQHPSSYPQITLGHQNSVPSRRNPVHGRHHSNTLPSYVPYVQEPSQSNLQPHPYDSPAPQYAHFPRVPSRPVSPMSPRPMSPLSPSSTGTTSPRPQAQPFFWVSDAVPPPLFTQGKPQGLEGSFQSMSLTGSSLPTSPKPQSLIEDAPAELMGSPGVPNDYDAFSPRPAANTLGVPRPTSPIFEMSGEPIPATPPADEPLSPRRSPAPSPSLIQHPRGSRPKAVTSCIDIPMSFTADWYWHPEAPQYTICSRCYVDHIYGTKFQNHFQHGVAKDGNPRTCYFSKPRMKDVLFNQALSSGSLAKTLDWMQIRAVIPNCKGTDGVKGGHAGAELKWYVSAQGEIPNFIACEACYEDHMLANPSFASHFTLLVHQQQGPSDTWICDMTTPGIQREYEQKSAQNDFPGFAASTIMRLQSPPCPQRKQVSISDRSWFPPLQNQISAYDRAWFVPKNASPNNTTLLCGACYQDYILGTPDGDEATRWEMFAGYEYSLPPDTKVRCARGVFNTRVLLSRAHETKDWRIFWRALAKIDYEPPCGDAGVTGGTWYTLPSQPPDFAICGACYAGVVEPLGIAHLWTRKKDSNGVEREVLPGRLGSEPSSPAPQLCHFNFAHPRLQKYIPRLLEMFYTHDARALEEYAKTYASMPVCPRDTPTALRRWYGWRECTICPECYVTFVRDHHLHARNNKARSQSQPQDQSRTTAQNATVTLASMIELRNAPFGDPVSCEMYSPRMRALYNECAAISPPNVSMLLAETAKRRAVYASTMPRVRELLEQVRVMGDIPARVPLLGEAQGLKARWRAVE